MTNLVLVILLILITVIAVQASVIVIQAKFIDYQRKKIQGQEKQIGSMFGQLGGLGRKLFVARLVLGALTILSVGVICALVWKLIPYLTA